MLEQVWFQHDSSREGKLYSYSIMCFFSPNVWQPHMGVIIRCPQMFGHGVFKQGKHIGCDV